MYSGVVADHRNLPDEIIEHILAREYKWNLDEIRRLPPKKFQAHIGICLVKMRIEVARAERSAFITAVQKQIPIKVPDLG